MRKLLEDASLEPEIRTLKKKNDLTLALLITNMQFMEMDTHQTMKVWQEVKEHRQLRPFRTKSKPSALGRKGQSSLSEEKNIVVSKVKVEGVYAHRKKYLP